MVDDARARTRDAVARLRPRRRADGRRDIQLSLPADAIDSLDEMAVAAGVGRAEMVTTMIRQASTDRRGA